MAVTPIRKPSPASTLLEQLNAERVIRQQAEAELQKLREERDQAVQDAMRDRDALLDAQEAMRAAQAQLQQAQGALDTERQERLRIDGMRQAAEARAQNAEQDRMQRVAIEQQLAAAAEARRAAEESAQRAADEVRQEREARERERQQAPVVAPAAQLPTEPRKPPKYRVLIQDRDLNGAISTMKLIPEEGD
jgi:colicin import membrane protein